MIRIFGGQVIDPANPSEETDRELWIRAGKIIAKPAETPLTKALDIDATGCVVMAGGVDMHCHIAGPKVNAGRRMLPNSCFVNPAGEQSGDLPPTNRTFIPTSIATGNMFTQLGYTTAFDAAIPGLYAKHVHQEFKDIPFLHKGFFCLFGNNHYVMDHIREDNHQAVAAYCAWMLNATKGYAIKIVNPGGVENWKQVHRVKSNWLDNPVQEFDVTPRQIVHTLAGVSDQLGLPHSTHIHCNNLGVPGNWETTLETMKCLEGHRGHFAHVQFHSYGGDPDDPGSFCSATEKLVEYVNNNENITVDVGHVNPGWAISMTGDTPFSYLLQRLTGNKWFSADAEQESSCGVIPFEYRPRRSLIHAVQWAIALEWYLLMDDPWRCAMTSDHPNGGAFWRYPEIIALLMDRDVRNAAIKRMPHQLAERTMLKDIDRELTLNDVAILTRAAPARILGLDQKGHLGVGADADITIYNNDNDRKRMFECPRYVINAGQIVVDDSQLQNGQAGTVHIVQPEYDPDQLPGIRDWFEQNYSLAFENYPVPDQMLAPEV
jgi:formylmethanofuran dehydrogenase subunit A